MSRTWRTTMSSVGGGERKLSSTTYKTYGLKEVAALIHQLRAGMQKPGEPRKKTQPISLWLLEEMIRQHFKQKETTILESIIVEDSKYDAK